MSSLNFNHKFFKHTKTSNPHKKFPCCIIFIEGTDTLLFLPFHLHSPKFQKPIPLWLLKTSFLLLPLPLVCWTPALCKFNQGSPPTNSNKRPL